MFQELKNLHCKSGHSLCCYVVKASLVFLKSKIDPKGKVYIFVIISILNVKRKWGMNFV